MAQSSLIFKLISLAYVQLEFETTELDIMK